MKGNIHEDRLMFGQWLLSTGKTTKTIVKTALEIRLRSSHRLPGEILANDFNVFPSRVELNRLLIEFGRFKLALETQRTDPCL